MREYSKSEAIIANIPYVAMVLLGTIIIGYTCEFSARGLVCASSYLAYGVVGALWIMIFICPFCSYYATKGCPCGYGTISAKIVKKGDKDRFAEKFKRHIPMIVPLWIIPVAFSGVSLWQSFSWWVLGFVSAFVIESWFILPIVSIKHACIECPQKEQCPWIKIGVYSIKQSHGKETLE